MKLFWKSAVLSAALAASSFTCVAQNSTSGGDQPPQQDAQGMREGAGGRRGSGIRGTVVSVSGSNVVIKNEQGVTWIVITTENTRVMRNREPLAVNAIQPGDEVMGMGIPDADKHEVHAMMVMDIPAAEVAKAKANMGKTYIAGRITAIDETKLTIDRTDHVSQVIQLDETTSLHKGGRLDPAAMQAAGLDGGMMGMGGGRMGGARRGGEGNAPAPNTEGEAITLADVKVGDSVIGLGSVKDGIFVPTDLHVQPRRAAANGAAPPPPQ